jgi:hypothetical protein
MRKRFRNESAKIDGKLPSLLRFTDEAQEEHSPSPSYASAQHLGPPGEWQRLEVQREEVVQRGQAWYMPGRCMPKGKIY